MMPARVGSSGKGPSRGRNQKAGMALMSPATAMPRPIT